MFPVKQRPGARTGSHKIHKRRLMHPKHTTFSFRAVAALVGLSMLLPTLTGCSNNPYPAEEQRASIIYRVFSDDPKTLDPSVCYVALEIPALIYSCFYQY